mmetsp:Transcript_2617/g.4674  ORF Transcript_2617/g.4674 Transcript_2617/m.4674 type:complete len:587 (-) Transcript_2617:1279-3039(-)
MSGETEQSGEDVSLDKAWGALKRVLGQVWGSLGLDDDFPEIASGLHPLSQVCLAEAKRQFRDAAVMLTSGIEVWDSLNGAQELIRAREDVLRKKKRLEDSRGALDACMAMASQRDPLSSDLDRMMQRLRVTARSAGAECFEEKQLDGNVLLAIYGRTFIVDFHYPMDGRKEPRAVFRYVQEGGAETHDTAVNAHCLDLIREGQVDVLGKEIEAMMAMEKLDARLPQGTLLALRGFEDNLVKLRQIEACIPSHGPLDRFLKGHGFVTRTLGGLELQYFLDAPSQLGLSKGLIPLSSISSIDMDHSLPSKCNPYRAIIGIEEAYTVKPVMTGFLHPSVVSEDASGPLPVRFEFHRPTTLNLPMDYVMKLCPALHVSRAIAYQLRSKSVREQPLMSNRNGVKTTSMQALLAPDVFKNVDVKRSEFFSKTLMSKGNSVFRFTHGSDDLVEGMTVHRVPVTHPRDVHQVLQLLRQQIVFNDIFSSCFVSKNPDDELLDTVEPIPVEVVVCSPPEFISVCVLEPSSGEDWNLAVLIQLNGMVGCRVHWAGGSNRAIVPDITASRLMQSSRNIPEVLHRLRLLIRQNAGVPHT